MKRFIVICATLLAFATLSHDSKQVNVVEQAAFSPQSIYKINCGNKEGTAFVVSPKLMITALHVSGESKTCRITGQGFRRDVSLAVKQRHPEHDMAMLQADTKLSNPIPINCDGVKMDSPYTIAGYPGTGGFAGHPAMGINLYYSRSDSPVQHMRAMKSNTSRGMSGGPVLTEEREAVGFLIGETTDKKNHTLVKEFRDLPICSDYTK